MSAEEQHARFLRLPFLESPDTLTKGISRLVSAWRQDSAGDRPRRRHVVVGVARPSYGLKTRLAIRARNTDVEGPPLRSLKATPEWSRQAIVEGDRAEYAFDPAGPAVESHNGVTHYPPLQLVEAVEARIPKDRTRSATTA